MWICYVDEAGCTGALPAATSDIQPIFVILGAIVDQTRLRELTFDFLELKRTFYPGALIHGGLAPATQLDWVLAEIKGAEIRKAVCASDRDTRRHAIGFLDKFLQLLERYQVRVVGRLYIKSIGVPIKSTAIYTSAMQTICESFQNWLNLVKGEGIIIADSRWKDQNAKVAHSIFTQKFKRAGDDHSRVVEMPTFGHSKNHIGLQIADLLCSALLFPMATQTYCTGYVTSCHVHAGHEVLKLRFGTTLSRLQHRYQFYDGILRWRGGIVIADGLAQRSGSLVFKRLPVVSVPAPPSYAALPSPGTGKPRQP